jgi:hypothetical protein
MTKLFTAAFATAVLLAVAPATAATAKHCKMATASTPQICATASTGHHLSVVVNGKWVMKNPAATPVGYVYMGGSRTDFTFTPTLGIANSWTSNVTLPAGRIWTIKITVSTGTSTKTLTLMTNIL